LLKFMMRQTGGSACGATSTKSRLVDRVVLGFADGLDAHLRAVFVDQPDSVGVDTIIDADTGVGPLGPIPISWIERLSHRKRVA